VGKSQKTQKRTLTEAELIEHCREQVAFLSASSTAFDNGFEGEAKRIATAIRVLIHDTAASKSVLGQLGVKDAVLFTDTAMPIEPANLLCTPGLVILQVTSGEGGRYIAPLEMAAAPGRSKPPRGFEAWWGTPVTKTKDGALFSRKDYVLTVANKEGGAHVDRELDEAWAQLTRDNAFGWMYFEGETVEQPFEADPALASVRQIAYELAKTFDDQLNLEVATSREELLKTDRTISFESKIGRNAPCPCGSGRKFKKCHGA
jgi:hypothetical protein